MNEGLISLLGPDLALHSGDEPHVLKEGRGDILPGEAQRVIKPELAAGESVQFSSVQFICSVVSDSLRPHESQHARPPCPSLSPGVHSDLPPSSL